MNIEDDKPLGPRFLSMGSRETTAGENVPFPWRLATHEATLSRLIFDSGYYSAPYRGATDRRIEWYVSGGRRSHPGKTNVWFIVDLYLVTDFFGTVYANRSRIYRRSKDEQREMQTERCK